MDAVLDGSGIAHAVHDGGGVLGGLDLLGTAQVGNVHFLEIHVQIGGDVGAAGQGGDILEHFLSAVTEAWRLDAQAGEGAAQTVDQQGGQGVALDVLSDNDHLLAGLHDLFQNRQDLLNGGDLLVGDQDIGIVNDGFHLVGVGDHVGGDIAAVELHAFHDVQTGFGGLGFLNGDDAGGGDLLHGLGDQLADFLVAGGNRTDAGDVIGAGDLLAVGLDGFHSDLNGLVDALAHDHRVRTGGHVLQTLAGDGLGQQGRGGGAVAGDVVGLGGDFADELRAHVLESVLKLHVLCDRHAVVGDQRGAVLLAEHDVAALGAEGNFNGIGQLVNAGLDLFSGFFAVNNLLCHD